MTTAAERRRRATRLAALAAIGAVVVTGVAAGVGAAVLYNSTQGRNAAGPSQEPRPFPQTPNVLLGVTNTDGELASAAVLTLSPGGQGGSVVTLPVSATPTRPSESTQATSLADSYAEDDEAGMTLTATSILGISFDQVEVVDGDELATLFEPAGPVQVDLPADVLTDESGTPRVVTAAGPQLLDAAGVAEALASAWDADPDLNGDVDAPLADENTEALWDGVAGAIGGGLDTGAAIGVDVQPGLDRFVARLFNGSLSVRRLASTPIESADGAVVTLLDRPDVLLVFGQLSPRKVSAPLDGIAVRVVVSFNDEDVSNTAVARAAIERFLFSGVNVVSVSTGASEDGAPEVSEVQMLDPTLEEQEDRFGPMIGEYEVIDTQYDIPGIGAVITIGESALSFYDVG